MIAKNFLLGNATILNRIALRFQTRSNRIGTTTAAPRGILLSLLLFCSIFCCGSQLLLADDAEGNEFFASGLEAEKGSDFVKAADRYRDAEFASDSTSMKLQSAIRTAEAYRKAQYYGKEFEAIENILDKYTTQVDFAAWVDREFSIGDEFFHGYQDPAFWSLRFIPWLTDKDRTAEIYEAAIKRAPFAERSGEARLRLAIHYLDKQENERALKLLRETIEYFPDSETTRHAYLELGNALYQMAEHGDGDGKYYDEAVLVFQRYQEKYPDRPENEWINNTLLKAKDAYADRLYGIAEYYSRTGKDAAAEVYLLEVLRRFPDSKAAVQSEALLTTIDRTYFPEQVDFDIPERYPKLDVYPIPEEEHSLRIAPENSDNRFLLPIYDLNLPSKDKKGKKSL